MGAFESALQLPQKSRCQVSQVGLTSLGRSWDACATIQIWQPEASNLPIAQIRLPLYRYPKPQCSWGASNTGSWRLLANMNCYQPQSLEALALHAACTEGKSWHLPFCPQRWEVRVKNFGFGRFGLSFLSSRTPGRENVVAVTWDFNLDVEASASQRDSSL